MNTQTERPKPVTRSRIYLEAWIAAEKALPEAARQLIEEHDRLYSAWRKAGWGPVPPELTAASQAVEADPLASIAFEFRKRTNEEGHKEWLAEQEAEERSGLAAAS